MTHLSPSEFVDFVEGTLPQARAAHVERCEACGHLSVSVARALRAVNDVAVPEPSPLFWDHLSARVRTALPDAPAPRAPWWRRPAAAIAWSMVAMVAMVATIIAIVAVRQGSRPIAPAAPAARVTVIPAQTTADEGDAAWDLLTIAASDLQLEDARAAGFGVRTATVDTAVLELSPAEREELGRLLQDELRHSGA